MKLSAAYYAVRDSLRKDPARSKREAVGFVRSLWRRVRAARGFHEDLAFFASLPIDQRHEIVWTARQEAATEESERWERRLRAAGIPDPDDENTW